MENYFLYFSTKTYVVDTQKYHLNEHQKHMFKLMGKKVYVIWILIGRTGFEF